MRKRNGGAIIRKVLLVSVGILSITVFPAFAADTSTVFTVQPQPKDLQHSSSTTGKVSINYTDGTLATLKAKENVTLEYLSDPDTNGNQEWKDTGITLTVKSDGSITAPTVAADSKCLNHLVRLKTASGSISDVFYINYNTYTENSMPTVLTGMSTSEQYGYTAGEEFYLVPDLEAYTKITEIRWQVSTDGGKTYKTFGTIQPANGDSLLYAMDADCVDTGNLYRYAINPIGNRITYSDPIETIIYEDYDITGSTLTVSNAGPSGEMNDYKSGRMAGLQPWKAKSASIKSLVLSDIQKIGAQAFKDLAKLSKVDLGTGLSTVGEESFSGCKLLTAVTIPAGTDEIEKDAFVGCTSLREVRIEDPDTVINSSKNTIPLTKTNTGTPTALGAYKSIVSNEHAYPVIYGYKGIAKDDDNKIAKTAAGSTAYDYAVTNGRAFMQIGAIDGDGYERPITWDYKLNSSNQIEKLSIAAGCDAISKNSELSVHIPKTVDGYEVVTLAGFEMSDADPICGKADTSTIKIPDSSAIVVPTDSSKVYISTQPVCVVSEDETVDFTVGAENATSYQWYYSRDNGTTWSKVTKNATGADTETLTVTVADWKSTDLFHCVVAGSDGTTVTTDNVWARESHVHDEECYQNGGVRDVLGNYLQDSDGNLIDSAVTLSTLYIPDTVATIKEEAFQSVEKIENIYSFSKSAQTVGESFYGENSPVCYTYSPNYSLRKATRDYKIRIFDISQFTGKTGDLTWTIDFDTRTLSLTGTGSSGTFTDKEDVPYYWAVNDMERIAIGTGVTGIESYAFADMVYAKEISNESTDISHVDSTAFQNVSSDWMYGNKKITTYVNNALYDAITDLNKSLEKSVSNSYQDNISALDAEIQSYYAEIDTLTAENDDLEAQIELYQEEGDTATVTKLKSQITQNERKINTLNSKIEKVNAQKDKYMDTSWANFSFNWMDTVASCGTGLKFTFTTSNGVLQISGDGEMTTFASDKDAPWRPVNDMIKKIIISSEVSTISNHAFHNLKNLRSVFNYGKNQKLTGGSDDIFDVIERHKSSGELTDTVIITIPDLDTSTAPEADVDAWYAAIAKQASTGGLNITLAQLRNWSITCTETEHTHTDSCYTEGEFTCTKTEHTHTDSCYDKSGTPYKLVPGEYYIPKTYDSLQILFILTGQQEDMVAEKYIVPVYTFNDENQAFSDSVPPESDGYKLMNIYNEKGQCGDDLTYYVSLDNALVIEGSGDMWDFEDGKAPWAKSAKTIAQVYMSEKMTSIGSFAFANMELMTEFDVPEKVTTIGKGAFKACTNLYSFTIGSQYTSIGSGIFAGCSTLRIVNADKNNLYSVSDGYLIEEKTKTILGFLRERLYRDAATKTLYNNPDEYTVPDGVKVIGAMAYYEASSFYNLIIPDSVIELQDQAFYGCTKIENIDLKTTTAVTVSSSAIDGCGTLYGTDDTRKYAIMYSVNQDFAKIAEKQGYKVVYHDLKNIKYPTAAYAGPTVMVGKSFDRSNVQIAIVYESGESETIYGTDSRMLFKDTTITQIGENKFTAIFDDGYGQTLTTNEFTVEGTNAIVSVLFIYTGPTIWYGEKIDTNYVLAKLTYADGSTKTVNGNATYSTTSGNKNCITMGQTTVSQEGENEIKVSYKDATSGTFNGTMTVECQNYVTGLTAEYHGGPVELAAGANGLELNDLEVTISWSDGTTETVNGTDPRINIESSPTVLGQTQIFEFSLNDKDRYGYKGSFTCSYTSNLENVEFDYVGAAVTNEMVFSFSDVQLTLHYTDGSSQKVKGDTVSGLEADNMIVHTADSTEEITMKYTVGANTFTGKIYVPGKIRIPVKLIVVKRPTKSVYQEGDVFDPEGMVVNCLFNNGVTQEVTDLVAIDSGGTLTENTKTITLSYEDSSSGYTIKTNMALNVNQYQKEMVLEKQFKEQYEISKVLFRSKKTEDLADTDDEDADDTDDTDDTDEDEDEDDLGKWQDITPLLNYSSYDEKHDAKDASGNYLYNAPEIKAGYGFELKVYTKYRTNRAGSEFNAFLKKTQWDKEFEKVYTTITHDEFMTKWKYLNDVYPQAAPTANPDILYFKTTSDKLTDENGDPIKNLISPDGTQTDFLVMEKTNTTETGELIDEGEWFNSTKIFEFPVRAIINDEETRRVYISKDAANPNQAYTDYTMQIISPAWFGYDPEPYFEGDKFHYSTDDGETYAQKSYAYNDPQTKYLHVCAGITVRVKMNNDVKTHILE